MQRFVILSFESESPVHLITNACIFQSGCPSRVLRHSFPMRMKTASFTKVHRRDLNNTTFADALRLFDQAMTSRTRRSIS